MQEEETQEELLDSTIEYAVLGAHVQRSARLNSDALSSFVVLDLTIACTLIVDDVSCTVLSLG